MKPQLLGSTLALAIALFAFYYFFDNQNTELPNTSVAINDSKVVTSIHVPTQHVAIVESLYREYQADVKACITGFAYLNQQEVSLTKLLQTDRNENISQILEKSEFSTDPSLQRIFRNPERFEISTNCHTRDYSARTINCIYCDVNHENWANEIEKHGVAERGLSIRLHILKVALKDLNYPFDEAVFGQDYEVLLQQARKTTSLYLRHFSEPLNSWLQHTADEIRNNKKNASEGAAGQTIQKQIDLMEHWAQTLEELKCLASCSTK